MSGWITEPIGRKKAMFFVNIPHLVAWTLLYYSTTLTEVFVASVLLGLGVGLMEAPIITYVGEIWCVSFGCELNFDVFMNNFNKCIRILQPSINQGYADCDVRDRCHPGIVSCIFVGQHN